MSIALLSIPADVAAWKDNSSIDISQIFDASLEAAHAHIFSIISPENSRSLCFNFFLLSIKLHVFECLRSEQNATCTNFLLAVWVAATIAIIIISMVGLLGVAVVPLVQKSYYNQVLQFLVALAVGALTGDAMLHLLPHVSSTRNWKGKRDRGPQSAYMYQLQ